MKPVHRVLSRLGARELTMEEVEIVSGAIEHTNVCTGLRTTGAGFGDGDGCGNDGDAV